MPVLLAIECDRHRAHPLEIALLESRALLLPEKRSQNAGKSNKWKDGGQQQEDQVRPNTARPARNGVGRTLNHTCPSLRTGFPSTAARGTLQEN